MAQERRDWELSLDPTEAYIVVATVVTSQGLGAEVTLA